MNASQGFDLHPGAAQDITEIWEFIAEENLDAARRVREEILASIHKLVSFPNQGHRRPDGIILLPTRRMKSLSL
jgi:plasmid stabilization system protein ParE